MHKPPALRASWVLVGKKKKKPSIASFPSQRWQSFQGIRKMITRILFSCRWVFQEMGMNWYSWGRVEKEKIEALMLGSEGASHRAPQKAYTMCHMSSLLLTLQMFKPSSTVTMGSVGAMLDGSWEDQHSLLDHLAAHPVEIGLLGPRPCPTITSRWDYRSAWVNSPALRLSGSFLWRLPSPTRVARMHPL